MKTIFYGPQRAHGTSSPDAYRSKHVAVCRGLGMTPWTWTGDPPKAYVSDARWVCDCPNCGNGPSVEPDWGIAMCFECGAVFEHVIVPDATTRAEAETILGLRHEKNRHWKITETLAQLREENVANGLPIE